MATNQIKSGKRPSSSRTKASPINADDLFINPLGLDPELIKVVEAKGHVVRFINAIQYKRFGHHQAHWRPISRKTLREWGYATIDTHDFTLGNSPDDFIYRGQDLVLATRPRDINERHKAYLAQEASRGKNVNKAHAEELRDMVRRSGLDAQVHEGYYDDGEKESEDDSVT